MAGPLFAALVAAAPAAAQQVSCSGSASPLAFGDVDVLSSAPVDVTSTVTVNCTVGLLGILSYNHVCVDIGAGSVGNTVFDRRMASGANRLSFQIYTDAARSNVFGGPAGGSSVAVSQTNPILLPGTRTSTVTVYGRVFGGQSAAVIGDYATNLDITLRYLRNYSAGHPGCGAGDFSSASFTGPVTATVARNCYVSANDLLFATTGSLTGSIDAASSLSVQCSSQTPYTLRANAGQGLGATVALRRMTQSSGETIDYRLYTDAGRTILWGDGTAGTSTLGGTGTGGSQTLSFFGRVPAQATPSSGLYNDQVTVTIVY
ncbi:spore coat U domain-containing protein [Zavarzinia compransoris]|uniref:Csu type fimbrial protein n=1 Tax=Zavarzinia marina TaxID=2911065 RepID=UPI001F2F4427|nr:spore coat U domain-containing protein [Zavarzinia marina]MCF4164230.1 spore coat U domain-containing protein [Zavarzinia marina]